MKKEIIIFTDGASKGNPGPGGYGAIIIFPEGKVVELGGGEKKTTNNRMELTGAIKALEEIRQRGTLTDERVTVYTDSKYLIGGMTGWIYGWQKNNWQKKKVLADGRIEESAVLNQDLWKKLMELISLNHQNDRPRKIKWNYVGGHVGVAGNERCDEIASAIAKGEKLDLYKGPLSKYQVEIMDLEHSEEKKATKYNNTKAYSYLSLVNGALNIDKTWAECEKRVKGVKNVKYQKAVSLEQEKEIIKSWGLNG